MLFNSLPLSFLSHAIHVKTVAAISNCEFRSIAASSFQFHFPMVGATREKHTVHGTDLRLFENAILQFTIRYVYSLVLYTATWLRERANSRMFVNVCVCLCTNTCRALYVFKTAET